MRFSTRFRLFWCLMLLVGMFAPLADSSEAGRCHRRSRRGCRASRMARSCPRQACCRADAVATRQEEAEPARISLFDGSSLAGWRIADEADFTSHGEVTVRDGHIELEIGNPATGVVRKDDDVPKINYEIELEAMRTGGGDFFCGLTFPIREQYCTLIVGGWGGGVVGLSNIDGMAASENSVASWQDFKDDRWYKIRLLVTEVEIKVWIDDEQLIKVETDKHNYDIWWEQEPMRPLGIATWYTSAALRSIHLRRVDPQDSGKLAPVVESSNREE